MKRAVGEVGEAAGGLSAAAAALRGAASRCASAQLLGAYLTLRRKALPDTEVCAGCDKDFGLLRPRHACRVCAARVCGGCAGKEDVRALGLGDKAAFVCAGCAGGRVAAGLFDGGRALALVRGEGGALAAVERGEV